MGHVSVGLKKFVLLQERDRDVFRFVSDQKFASKEQLRRKFFLGQGMARTGAACPRRLAELVKFGFLEKRHVATDLVQLYQVGRLALDELARQGEPVLPYLGRIDLKGFDHDLAVGDARILFEEVGARHWRSERRLHQAGRRGHVPDAIFELGQNRCALEMELSLKRLDRYPQIFRGYVQDPDRANVVLYVCGTRAAHETLWKLTREYRRFYFTLRQDLERLRERTPFSNQHDRFELGEIR
jgi:hypothetical protein